jgi:hypothetical protein
MEQPLSSSDTDMEFLNFATNDDSLDLSLSGFDHSLPHSPTHSLSSNSHSHSHSSDWSPTHSPTPSSDFDMSYDILGDIHLPSLGETATARKLLSQLLSDTPQPLPHSLTHHNPHYYPSTHVSYTKEGHMALQHMNDDLRTTREKCAALQVELTHVKKQQLASRDELHDLVSE